MTVETYSKYVHPAEGPEVVNRGFSWPGILLRIHLEQALTKARP